MKPYVCLLLFTLALVQASPLDGNIIDIATQNKLTSLLSYLSKAQLTTALQNPNKTFTLFAPSDAAFAKLPASIVASWSNVTLLTEALLNHVAPNTIKTGDLFNDERITTLAPQGFSTPLRANIYGNPAIFSINGAVVSTRNILASNGVVHIIDAVLLPVTPNLPAAISNNPNLSKFVALLKSTALSDTVENAASLTVFVPTNAAFAAFMKDASELSTQAVADVLKYHLVSSTYYSSSVVTTLSLTTQDMNLKVNLARLANVIQINKVASVTSADNNAANGVFHVVDRVLVPPSSSTSSGSTSASTQSTSSQSTHTTSTSTTSTSTTSSSTQQTSTMPASTERASTRTTSTAPGSTHINSSAPNSVAPISASFWLLCGAVIMSCIL